MHSIQLPHADNVIVKAGQPIVVNNPPNIGKPFKNWPLWAKAVALARNETDKGIGDTIERTIGHTNSATFKAWYLATFKKSCGCSARKERWNAEFNYTY